MHKMLTGVRGEIDPEGGLIPFGVAKVTRTGTAATVATYGVGVSKALKAAEILAEDGIEINVDLRTVWPLDLETVATSVRKTGHLLVLSEANGPGSVGGHVAAAVGDIVFPYLDAPVRHLSARHSPIAHSPGLMAALVPQVPDVVEALRAIHDYDIVTAGQLA